MSEQKTTSLQNQLSTAVNTSTPRYQRNAEIMRTLVAGLRAEEDKIREGGGAKAIAAQHKKQRLTARERLRLLLEEDPDIQIVAECEDDRRALLAIVSNAELFLKHRVMRLHPLLRRR